MGISDDMSKVTCDARRPCVGLGLQRTPSLLLYSKAGSRSSRFVRFRDCHDRKTKTSAPDLEAEACVEFEIGIATSFWIPIVSLTDLLAPSPQHFPARFKDAFIRSIPGISSELNIPALNRPQRRRLPASR
ncbi:hypothetical protein TNCV_1404901 [Trichonephila clavipes]|nr:hypothetical protein TNCV_1404901 [Trichonephila clavipes]